MATGYEQNYVKFRRGTPGAFEQILNANKAERDTLYFIYEEDESSAELYLGSKRISGGDGVSTSQVLQDLEKLLKSATNNSLLVYEDSQWTTKSINEILNEYKPSLPKIASVENINENNHLDLIDQEYATDDPKAGDIIIVKDIIGENIYQHTGYVFDGSNWLSMDGKYSAENVYFEDDFIFTEDVGTIKVDSTGSTKVAAAGKSVKEFFASVFAQEKNPETVSPSATIKLTSASNVEVGTEYTPKYSITFDPGSYSFDSTTGVSATYSVNNGEATSASGSVTSFTVTDDTNYKVSANINYTDGTVPKTNLGNDYADGQIKADTISVSTSAVKGYRNCFYGTLTDKSDLTSDIIRSLTKTNAAIKAGSTLKLNIPVGAMRIVLAYDGDIRDVSSIKDDNVSNLEIVGSFKKQEIEVAGVNGYSPKIYKIFILDYAIPTTKANIYNITI